MTGTWHSFTQHQRAVAEQLFDALQTFNLLQDASGPQRRSGEASARITSETAPARWCRELDDLRAAGLSVTEFTHEITP